MTLQEFLEKQFDRGTANAIVGKADALYNEMCAEQKSRLSGDQYKPAKNKILKRISLFLAMREHEDEDKVLAHVKAFYYPRFGKLADLVFYIFFAPQFACRDDCCDFRCINPAYFSAREIMVNVVTKGLAICRLNLAVWGSV